MKHLLVTNDFPPKVGGIQSYLWELWRRLPADDVTVLTLDHPDARGFDEAAGFRIERLPGPVLLPTARLRRRILALAGEVGAELILLDPALPVGHIGPSLGRPYGLILHGAEITVPGRLPGARQVLARTLREARLIVAAGGYPAAEAERAAGRSLPVVSVPPGVDTDRFVPLPAARRAEVREQFGVRGDSIVISSISRLVPRKGMDVLIRATARLARDRNDLEVLVGGTGRDRDRLERLAADEGAPVRFLGRVDDEDLPALYGASDLFAMVCRNRWVGLEQEGFGIVFLEAAACGVAQIAGNSGGAAEAVDHGVTGLVVDDPRSVDELTGALSRLLDDPATRSSMGRAGRHRAEQCFSYDVLAATLAEGLS